MFAPVRALLAPRSQASPGVLAAAACVAAAFTSIPFLIPDIATELNVSLGTAGLLSTFQVGGFAATSFLAGRLLRPQARLHKAALLLVAGGNVLSAFSPRFWMILLCQMVVGVGLGLLTWLSWAEATRHRQGLADVASIGPFTSMVGAPIFGWISQVGNYRAIFALLAVLSLATLFVDAHYGDLPVIGRNVSDSRTNRLLLLALFTVTLSGSGLFVFAAAAGRQLAGLSPTAVSFAFSLNALVGVVANRFSARRGSAGLWLLAGSVAAAAIGTVSSAPVYIVAMTVWGFVWWMGVPAVFRLLAERSLSSAERVGDAQSLMALGRVFGPLIGGVILGTGQFGRLALAAALGLTAGSLLVLAVEVARIRTDARPSLAADS
ncbi:MAG TPA: MFS transporter [Acidimicrobiia bacterium]|nr:MFS transporter [Acidimicrobiia bacterium]